MIPQSQNTYIYIYIYKLIKIADNGGREKIGQLIVDSQKYILVNEMR